MELQVISQCRMHYLLVGRDLFSFSSALLHTQCLAEPGPACRLQPLYTLNFASYHVRFIADLLTCARRSFFSIFLFFSFHPSFFMTFEFDLCAFTPVRMDHHVFCKNFLFLSQAVSGVYAVVQLSANCNYTREQLAGPEAGNALPMLILLFFNFFLLPPPCVSLSLSANVLPYN